MMEYPVLFCLVCIASQTVEYSSTNKASVDCIFLSMSEDVRDLFMVVEYRAITKNEME